MAKRLIALSALLALTAGTAAAQDAKAVLQAAAKTMGTDNLKTIQISATEGFDAAAGQSYLAGELWPHFQVTSYTRTIDFDAKSSKEELTLKQGNYPARGAAPIVGERRDVAIVSGNYAWNMQGTNAVPTPELVELRQLEIMLTPHGFIKAALAGNATAAYVMAAEPSGPGRNRGARKAVSVSFTALGKYKVYGTITDQNIVEVVHTFTPDPVYGDMMYDFRYFGYKDFNGVKYPTTVHVHKGNPQQGARGREINLSHDWRDITVSNVQANLSVPALAIPDAVRTATIPPVRVESQKLADGVWLVGGGTHNSVAVEFRDFVTVVEAPLSEARSLAVIGEVNKLVPNKSIRYLVNTHHHSDHLGGIRTYVCDGVTVITHESNFDFYRDVVFSPAPRTLQPDRLSTLYPYFSGDRAPYIDTVNIAIPPGGGDDFARQHEKYVVSDGVRTMEIYPITGLAHSGDMMVAYLPKEKILVNADMYSPPAAGAQPTATPSMQTLYENIQRLKLDVAQHAPIHGRVGTQAEFLRIMGKSSN